MRPFGELQHGAHARLARICDDGRHARSLEQQAFANAVGRNHDVARLDARHHFGGGRDAGDDYVGARRAESRNYLPFRRRHSLEEIQHMLHLSTRDDGAVYARRPSHPLTREDHGGEVGKGAAGPDQLCAVPVAARYALAETASHEPSQARERIAIRRSGEELLGQPYRSKGKREQPVEKPVGAERELE